jgi:stress-induced morphogen
MSVDITMLTDLIRQGIPDAEVRVEDLRGDGKNLAAYVVSPSFAGLSRVEQHRMVHKALDSVIGKTLHALAIQTSVPK